MEHKREIWHKKQKLMKLEPHRLVFIDETSTMTRIYGRSVKGTRLEADAPYGHWKTQVFIAGLHPEPLQSFGTPLETYAISTHPKSAGTPSKPQDIAYNQAHNAPNLKHQR